MSKRGGGIVVIVVDLCRLHSFVVTEVWVNDEQERKGRINYYKI